MAKPTRKDLERFLPHLTMRYAAPNEARTPQLPEAIRFPVRHASLVVGDHRSDYRLGGQAKDAGGSTGGMVTTSSPVGGNPMGFAPIQRGDVVVGGRRKPLRDRKIPTKPITEVAANHTQLPDWDGSLHAYGQKTFLGKAQAPPQPGQSREKRPVTRIWAE